jgi:L-ribulose-5-phosphate 3-epimerase
MNADYDQHYELFKHTIAIASSLETRYIRLFSFFMEEEAVSANEATIISRLKEMSAYAKKSDIILLHENEKDIYGDTPERCLHLVKSINSPNFRLIFDPANFVQCGVTTYPDAFIMLSEYVDYMHIKDAILSSKQVVPAGHGDGSIHEILRALDEKGYEGFLSIEPHLGDFEGYEQLEQGGNQGILKEKSGFDQFMLATDSLKSLLKGIE